MEQAKRIRAYRPHRITPQMDTAERQRQALNIASCPPKAFIRLPSTGQLVLVQRGGQKYLPVYKAQQANPEALNAQLSPPASSAAAFAMLIGTMAGWSNPLANPMAVDTLLSAGTDPLIAANLQGRHEAQHTGWRF